MIQATEEWRSGSAAVVKIASIDGVSVGCLYAVYIYNYASARYTSDYTYSIVGNRRQYRIVQYFVKAGKTPPHLELLTV
jgi:hypothetical protein